MSGSGFSFSGSGQGNTGFSFGNSQNASKPSLFGNQPANTSNANNTQTSSGGPFGQANAPADGAKANSSLFGTQSSNQGSIFGSAAQGNAAGGSNTGSTGAFSFGNNQPASNNATAPTNNTSKAFSFGQAPAASTASNTTASFGGNNNPSGAFSFGSGATKTDGGSNSLFGNKPATESSAAKPAFGFGGAQQSDKPSFGFGATATQTTDKPAATGFSFNSNPVGNSDAKPAFSFGNKPEEKNDKPAFSLGSNSGGATASKPALSFGASSSVQQSDSKPSAFSFGAQSGEKKDTSAGFSFGAKADEKKDDKPAFSFGAKPDEKKDDKPAFSFGAKTDEKKDDKPSFSFGAKTEVKQDNKPSVSFGAKPEEKTSDKSKDDSKPAFSFGASSTTKTDDTSKDKTQETKSASSTTSGFSFGKTESKSETAETSDKQVNVKTQDIQAKPMSIKNKTLEDLITKWTNQLTTATSTFEKYAKDINTWDSILVSSGEKLTQLYNDAALVEQTQQKIDQNLTYIEGQQDELEALLDGYNAQAESLLSSVSSRNFEKSNVQSNGTGSEPLLTNDQIRERAFHTAELLEDRLDFLGGNLSSLVNEINNISDTFNKTLTNDTTAGPDVDDNENNTVEDILQLLNTHLESLKWIETNEQDLKNKLKILKENGL